MFECMKSLRITASERRFIASYIKTKNEIHQENNIPIKAY